MAELEAKVHMSLDDIIKMEKQKKGNSRQGLGRGGMRGNMRGGPRNNQRGGPRNMMGNNRGNMRNNNRMNNNMNRMNNNMNNNRMNNNINNNRMNNNINNNRMNNNINNNRMNNNRMNNNRRGQWRRYPQNNMQGQYMQKRYNNNNNNQTNQNLRRSRSSMSLNRMNANNSFRGPRGGYSPRRGGRFGLHRSRSRTNLSYATPSYAPQNNRYQSNGFLQRTNSLPDLREPSSVYYRLGYQNTNEAAYRNRIKRNKNSLTQKNLKMQQALQLFPTGNNMVPVERRQRRYSVGSVMNDRVMRLQRQAQYEQKLIRINSRSHAPESMDYMSSLNDYALQRPTLNNYSPQSQKSLSNTPRRLRGKSFSRSLTNLNTLIPKQEQPSKPPPRQNQRRARSRSRSRVRNVGGRNNVFTVDSGDIEDRSFSEVMYSLANNFGVTGRTLNDRFSLV